MNLIEQLWETVWDSDTDDDYGSSLRIWAIFAASSSRIFNSAWSMAKAKAFLETFLISPEMSTELKLPILHGGQAFRPSESFHSFATNWKLRLHVGIFDQIIFWDTMQGTVSDVVLWPPPGWWLFLHLKVLGVESCSWSCSWKKPSRQSHPLVVSRHQEWTSSFALRAALSLSSKSDFILSVSSAACMMCRNDTLDPWSVISFGSRA